MTDVLEQLLPAKWRDVEFPTTRFKVSVAHDLVEHKYWGVDGARVEATGLAPLRFSFSAPLTNGIVPGKGERWSVLYPNQFRALLAAFQKRETGALQHPEFGEIACKAERMDIDWEATKRGGCDAELSFVETILPFDTSFLNFPSPVQEIDLAALDLDSEQTNKDLEALLAAKGLSLPKYEEDFSDFARSIQGVVDTVTVLSSRAAGKIDSIVYRANNIIDSCERAKSALTWPAVRQAERIKAAAFELRENLLALDRAIAYYRVPADTTLAGVARQVPNAKVGDLIRLNPSLMQSPVVPEGTVVRYYAAAA